MVLNEGVPIQRKSRGRAVLKVGMGGVCSPLRRRRELRRADPRHGLCRGYGRSFLSTEGCRSLAAADGTRDGCLPLRLRKQIMLNWHIACSLYHLDKEGDVPHLCSRWVKRSHRGDWGRWCY